MNSAKSYVYKTSKQSVKKKKLNVPCNNMIENIKTINFDDITNENIR